MPNPGVDPKAISTKDINSLLDIIVFAHTFMKHFLVDKNGVFKGLRRFQKSILGYKGRQKRQIVLRIGRRCGKTVCLAIKAIFEVITRRNYNIIIITPGKNHYSLIYDMIWDRMIIPCPELRACVISATKGPPGKLKFSSGSSISFFTAGTKSGSGALGIRGQDADLIILDEADFLSAIDMEAILALKLSRPDSVMWASSTPTGKRSFFWRWCNDKREDGWKEFHYTSPEANPDWDAVMDKFARDEYPGEAYKREILAEFGREDVGVFNKELTDEAFARGTNMYNYGYTHMPWYGYMQEPPYDAVRIMGVDWDKFCAPTNIVILEEIPGEDICWIPNRTQVPQGEFTLTNAVNTIIKMNKVWNPSYIYIDKGYGEVQVELFKLYGQDHKDSGILKKLKPVSFSSKIVTTSAIDGVVDKKDAKPFMVNLIQRAIEDKKIIFNPRDTVMKDQFINYHIKHYGANGRPIFEDENDHCIAAVGLALLGYTQNYDILFKSQLNAVAQYVKEPILKHADNKTRGIKYLSVSDFAMDRVNPAYRQSTSTYRRGGDIGIISRSYNNPFSGGRTERSRL